jgi:hypothetical protein
VQLKIVLPHYPLFNDFADEVVELRKALKTVRAQLGSTLPANEFDRLVMLLHETESALNRGGARINWAVWCCPYLRMATDNAAWPSVGALEEAKEGGDDWINQPVSWLPMRIACRSR